MKIIISKNDFDYLSLILGNYLMELDYKKEGGSVLLFGNESAIEVLLDGVSDLLSDKGFDSESNLTQTGLRLEKIIDKISDVLYR